MVAQIDFSYTSLSCCNDKVQDPQVCVYCAERCQPRFGSASTRKPNVTCVHDAIIVFASLAKLQGLSMACRAVVLPRTWLKMRPRCSEDTAAMARWALEASEVALAPAESLLL